MSSHRSKGRSSGEGSSSTASTNSPRQPTKEELEQMDQQKVTPELLEYMKNFQSPYMKDVSAFERLAKIGEGTFG
ncbi:unnamed protein product [Gongylonema pulchrum]|uniref:Protein kinase domain-containing protein n=1 Tax=Gongylonema pulchrum TaxID=637853 RepID=A0A183DCJ0_9BILA|nr:unnamed protein product [Gongylonema pulchrum]